MTNLETQDITIETIKEGKRRRNRRLSTRKHTIKEKVIECGTLNSINHTITSSNVTHTI